MMLHKAWILTVVVLLSGCTDQADPEEEGRALDAGTVPDQADRFDAANFTKVREELYAFQELLVGAAPGSAALEDHYGSLIPAREDTFQVGEGVWKLSFSPGMECGTGSGRVVVHGPDGQRVYASEGWNLVGAPSGPCAGLVEQVEEKGGQFPAGEYTVTYYVAGAMDLGLKVTATYLVPVQESTT